MDLAFESGAADYVTKPIHWAVLFQRVKRILENRWAMAELKRQIEKKQQLTEKLERVNQELQRLASTDSLTQIANRGSFDRYLEREWRQMGREQRPLSLILCDVDFFKRYNDTYGHQAGDECLKQIAQVLSQNARRPADLPARYGGEEFAVILPNTEGFGAVAVAEIIRTKVNALRLTHAASEVSEFVSLSLGVSSVIPQPGSSMDSLITKADEALYQAKEQGRDRVVFNEWQG